MKAFVRILQRLQAEARQYQSTAESFAAQVMALRQQILDAWQGRVNAFALLEEVAVGRDGAQQQQQLAELQRAVTALEFRAAEHKSIAEEVRVSLNQILSLNLNPQPQTRLCH
jgi:hypothetical protein